MEGRLKQKLQGEHGVLCWKSRNFVLGSRGRSLQITDDGYGPNDPSDGGPGDGGAGTCVTHVSLEGARHAAAWSGIDAFNGCGFDLVWASGRTWSLLCDDPFSRKSWVDALNLAIKSTANTPGDIDAIASGAGQRNVSARGPQRGRTSGTTAARRRHPPDVVRPHSPPAAEEQSSRFPRHSSVRPSAQNTGHRSPQSGGTRGSRRYGDRWSCEDRTPPGDGAVVGALVHDVIAPTEGERHNHQRREGASRTAGQHNEPYPSDVSGPAKKGVFSPPLTGASAGARGSDEGSGGGGTVGSMDSSGGGRGRGRSIARERSEELARASAATWEHFQQLLERSRESKARFDRAMDGTAGGVASSATTSSGSLSASAVSTPSSSSSQAGDRKGGAGVGVAGRKTRAGVPPVGFEPIEPSRVPKVEAAAVGVAGTARRNGSVPTSVGGSSTDRVSDVSTPRSRPTRASSNGGRWRGGDGGGGDDRRARAAANSDTTRRASRTAKNVTAHSVSCEDGGYCTADSGVDADVDAPASPSDHEHERSRLSAAVTDVETSLLLEESSGEGSPSVKRDGRSTTKSRSSSNGSSGGGGGIARRREAATTTTATAVNDRVRRLEVDLATARQEATTEAAAAAAATAAAAAARTVTEDSLQQKPPSAVVYPDGGGGGGGGGDGDSECERLRKELAALRATVSEEQEQRRETANPVAAATERERGREEAAAAAAAAAAVAAAAAATQSQAEARLEEALAKAAKAERERAEAVRQREELEEALAREIGERRRVTSLLEARSRSESALRERLEATAAEGDLKARLASTRSQLEAVSLERDALAEELDQCISRLGDQAREVASALRSKQQRKIAEISSRCEVEKETLREQLVLEAAEKAREETRVTLSAQERRIRGEVAAKAAKDAKRREKQLREAKAEAESAGEATRRDIDKLRGLHARRVKRLEALLKEEGDNLADARREIASCKATMAGDAAEFQRWTENHRDESTKLLKELAVIQKKVDRAVATEAQAREREGLAMGRLRKVMEEARLERAEGAEVKRQLREALAELESDRNAQARRARANLQLQRAAEIAQQEVAMVESERARWYEERRSMETAMERLTRLVYGTTAAAPGGNTSGDGNSSAAAAAGKSTGKKAPTGFPWKPPGGIASRGHGSNGGSSGTTATRAACSPIGVNAFRERASATARGVEGSSRKAASGVPGGRRTG